MDGELDKTGLGSVLFDGFAATSSRRYLYICNMKTNVSRWCKEAVDYFGLPGEYFLDAGLEWANHVHPDDKEKYLKDIEALFEGKKDRHQMDYRALNKNGQYVMCTCHGVVQKDQGAGYDLFIGTIENHGIMDNVDSITNLYNIYEFWQYMEKVTMRGDSVIELLIGLNNFSEYNDLYGYSFGDEILRGVAEHLRILIGDYGRIFRMDGVRFALCFEDAERQDIEELYKVLQRELRHSIYVENRRIAINISGGLIEAGDKFDIFAVGNGARFALVKSKYEHHGELYIFDNESRKDNIENLEILSGLRRSILNDYNGFYIHYQPIVSAKTKEIIGAEALLRWKDSEIGEVSPNRFVPLIENDPSFFELGNWIIRKAIMEMGPILDFHPDFSLNVNIAYSQMSRIAFRQSIVEILEETGFPPQNLCLEMTERCRQLEKNYLFNEINFLKSLGIRVAIDDFGTGTAAMNLVSNLPVDLIKFDLDFTQSIKVNKRSEIVFRAFTKACKEIGINICMEGVEDEETAHFLEDYKVYSMQGYYFSKPICIEDFVNKYYMN